MKVVAIIQARIGSTRLPGKVLMPLGGHPVLAWCVRAALAAPGIDEVRVATTTQPADDAIARWCEANVIPCWRGSEIDVLERFYDATATLALDDIVLRLTGDCPFLDPQVIGAVVALQRRTFAAYCSNTSPRSYPDGLDVQGFSRDALISAYDEARRLVDRDCVTTWIERNRSRFPAETLINPIPGMAGERWVLDTADDFKFCEGIADAWPWDRGPPSLLDILGVLDAHPGLRAINAAGVMNERYFEALAEEPIHARSYQRSQAQFEKAKAVIPLAAQTFSKSHLQYPQPSPLFLSHGQGGLAWDIDGNEYVDLVSALLPTILGARDPDVDAAIRRQLCSGISLSLATELEAELAETLCRLIPCAEAVRFGKTGTDATTAAVRLARAHTGRDRVLICGGYHGWADWSVERNIGVPQAVRGLTTRVPFGDMDAIAKEMRDIPGCETSPLASDFGDPRDIETGRKLRKWADRNMVPRPANVAAIIVEPESNPDYLRHLRNLCDATGTILIFDEVITGFRFSLGGAQKHFDVIPDLATFGKAMANGMPLSAIVGRREIMKRMAPPDNIFYSGTMFGETLSLAAAIATIKKLERDAVIPKLWETGLELCWEAEALIFKHQIGDAIQFYGAGPLKRIKFRSDTIAALFRKEMIASGTLIASSHNLCAAHTASDIRRVLKSYDHTLRILREAMDNGDIAERLAGGHVEPMVRAS